MSHHEHDWPKISIITPSYNQGQFIEETIRSVLDQEYPNLEYWVIDGGSTDNTVKILKKFGKKINWISEPDKGQTDAINKGLKKVTGEIIAYINSDDYYLPDALWLVAHEFLHHPEAQWVTGDYIIVDERGQERDTMIAWYKKIQRWKMKLLPFLQPIILGINNPIIQPSTFWRRELQKNLGPFRTNLRYTMDYDFWLRALKVSPPHIISEKLSAFRIHSQSKGGSQYEKQLAEQLQVAREHRTVSPLLFLQSIHNRLIIWWYKRTK